MIRPGVKPFKVRQAKSANAARRKESLLHGISRDIKAPRVIRSSIEFQFV
jgi:hypothetical protein